jgi:HlyD family secretion protein
MTRRRAIILGAAAAAVAAIVIANLRMSYESSVRVEATQVKRGAIVEKVSGPGVIYAESQVKLSSSVMGRITRLAVKEGQDVAAGDVLLEIDSSQYRALLRQAEASRGAARAGVDLAAVRVEDAAREVDRVSGLASSGLVSDKEAEVAQSALAAARAEYEASMETAAKAEAVLAAARDDLAETVITSPITGTVTSLNVEEGEIVITGTMNNPGTVIMTVSNLDTMETRADIDETDVAKVALGQAAEISVDAFPDTVLAGVVSVVGSSSSSARSFSASSDERATFEVRIRVRDRIAGLRPGMATTVEIVTASRDSVLFVPIQALVSRETGEPDASTETEGVFAVDGSRTRFVPLRTGISDDKNIEILGGLSADSRVVVGPFKVLRDLEDSTKVKVVKAEE